MRRRNPSAEIDRAQSSASPEPPSILQVEKLSRNVLVGVQAADEGPHLAPRDAFDDLAELFLGCVLEVQAEITQALMLTHLGHPLLRRRQAVFEGADDQVGTGKVRSRLGRS